MTSAKDLAERLRDRLTLKYGRDDADGNQCQFVPAEDVHAVITLLTRLAALGEPDADLVKRLRFHEDDIRNNAPVGKVLGQAADTIEGLNLKLAEANAAREAAEERAHYAEGTADLAMKHRDEAEARLATIEAALIEADDLAGRLLWWRAQVLTARTLPPHGPQDARPFPEILEASAEALRAALHPEGQKDQVRE